MTTIDPHTYQQLYAKYLTHERAIQMMELAGPVTGKRVLDLCGGLGDLSMASLSQQASAVTLVDMSEQMASRIPRGHFGGPESPQLQVIIKEVSIFLRDQPQAVWDVAFCRQAVNYWLDKFTVKDLGRVMVPGGVFVFNTFNLCPPAHPEVKDYEYQGRLYKELSWLTGESTIQHVQICEGMAPHLSTFWWISPEEFDCLAEDGGFESEILVDGRTSVYRWVKR